MLGRLRMSVDECIKAYTNLAKEIFNKQRHRFGVSVTTKLQEKFNSEVLKSVVQKLLKDRGVNPEELLKDDTPQATKV